MKKIIIANWKMYLSLQESILLADNLKRNLNMDILEKEVVICPSYPAISETAKIFKDTKNITIGAQDLFWEERGAYTGEVAPRVLKELGCEYVILGHSERRKFLNETNDLIHKKVRVALKNKITPIICIGENWEERQNNEKDYVLIRQVSEALDGIDIEDNQKMVIAYEPVWAISAGTGIVAEPEEVKYASEVIRQVLIDLFDSEIISKNIRIIYGGSVKPENINNFSEAPFISGFLIGGASLDAEKFIEIIKGT